MSSKELIFLPLRLICKGLNNWKSKEQCLMYMTGGVLSPKKRDVWHYPDGNQQLSCSGVFLEYPHLICSVASSNCTKWLTGYLAEAHLTEFPPDAKNYILRMKICFRGG